MRDPSAPERGVNEDESWPRVIVAGVLFTLMLIVFPALIWLTAAAMDISR